jgi:uncharacterized membrane protein
VLKEKLRNCSSIKGIILLPILTKTLGAELYGIWAQMLVTVSLLMPLALLQLGFAMTKFLAAEKDKEKVSKKKLIKKKDLIRPPIKTDKYERIQTFCTENWLDRNRKHYILSIRTYITPDTHKNLEHRIVWYLGSNWSYQFLIIPFCNIRVE